MPTEKNYQKQAAIHDQTHYVFEINKGGIEMKIVSIIILVALLVL